MRKFFADLMNPTATGVSFGRVMACWALSNVLSWDTANLVFAWQFNHHLPPGLAPLALLPDVATMAGQVAFVTAFYAITKYGDIKNGSGTGTPGAP
jgi:hypothetical protein